MRAAIASLMFATILAGSARGVDIGNKMPPGVIGVAPQLVKVSRVTMEKGELIFVATVVRYVWETVPGAAVEEGQTAPPNRRVRRPVYESRVASVPLESTTFFDASGEKLTSEEASKRIKAESVVAISGDGEPVHPAFLAALAKDTVVIVSIDYAMRNATEIPGGVTMIPGPGPAIAAPMYAAPPGIVQVYSGQVYTDPSAPGPSTDQPVIPPGTVVPVYPTPGGPAAVTPIPVYPAPSYPSTEAPAFRHVPPPVVTPSAPVEATPDAK